MILDMELNLLPHAIAWIGGDIAGFPLLRLLVRGMPSLCDYIGNAKVFGGKRKLP